MTPKNQLMGRLVKKYRTTMPLLPEARHYPRPAAPPAPVEKDNTDDWPLINDRSPTNNDETTKNAENAGLLPQETPKTLVNAFALHLPNPQGGVTIVAGPWKGSVFSIVSRLDPEFEMHFPTGTVKKNAFGFDDEQNVYFLGSVDA